jgi:hypothetical protein
LQQRLDWSWQRLRPKIKTMLGRAVVRPNLFLFTGLGSSQPFLLLLPPAGVHPALGWQALVRQKHNQSPGMPWYRAQLNQLRRPIPLSRLS